MPFVVVSCGEQKPEETPIPQNDKNEQKKVEKEQTEADDAQEEAKKLEEEANKENDAKKNEGANATEADVAKAPSVEAEKDINDVKQVEGDKKAENKMPTPSASDVEKK